MKIAIAALGAAALGIAALGVAHAQDAPTSTVVHRVRQGDSLELIAAEMYGDRTKAVLIVEDNKLPRGHVLKPGDRLRIPISREVTTSPGDTFESLAATHLGSARRAPFLAEINGIPVDDSLPAGTIVTIPLTVAHTASTPESLSEIAKAYFGDVRQAELLRRYNFLDKRTLDKNESLVVPVFNVRSAAARQPPIDAESKARRDRRRDACATSAKALPAARLAWTFGDYAAVKSALGALDPDLDYLDTNDAIEVAVLLGAAHVAFGDAEAALATFKRAVDRQPHHVLKRYDYSPRILGVWQAAGGQVE